MTNSILDKIGNTPLVEIKRLNPNPDVTVLAKLEYMNPGGSVKDRAALHMIEAGEKSGELTREKTVIEATSGNTGIGLALVCAVKGYPFVAVMSKGNSMERARMMSALGAEVVLVNQLPTSRPGQVSGGDLELVEKAAQEITAERDAFRADQFHLQSHPQAHYLNTAQEVLRQTDGNFDAFCDYVGTAGSYAGCAAAFKEYNSDIQCYLVEPATAAVLSGQRVTNPNHRIQGGGYSMTDLPFINSEQVDGFIQVTDEEAIHTARELARVEGIFAGYSAGANVAAALSLLKGELSGATIVVLLSDSGLKYLSTDLWP